MAHSVVEKILLGGKHEFLGGASHLGEKSARSVVASRRLMTLSSPVLVAGTLAHT